MVSTRFKSSSMKVSLPLACLRGEARITRFKNQLELHRRAVAVLGQMAIDRLRRLGTGNALPEKEDLVGVLFQRPAVAQIRQARLSRLALFHRPRQLRQRDHPDTELAPKRLEVARD